MGGMTVATARFFIFIAIAAATRMDGRGWDVVFVVGWFVFLALTAAELRGSRLETSSRLFGPLWFRRLTAGLALAGGGAVGVMMSFALLST
jgi:hypothetical protein